MSQIQYEDFTKLEIHVGTITRTEPFPEARKPAYKLWIDFGETIGVKQSSAQITDLYSQGELVGRQVLAVTNFPPKRIAGFRSEVLVLGVDTENGEVALIRPDREVPPGRRMY
ncbi:tRNA-binding protein [Desmospora profundinema]|uniref:tRNA-binding protein n=1 Tax=Desmospora profundinema TaxID=1571184 RepID=A0ABU1IRC3_9BACL|nr:tRNA-binding protein [Desmospora profundinema]MDR6227273.1 tRNA-binding protein [Desmospora profundinema]